MAKARASRRAGKPQRAAAPSPLAPGAVPEIDLSHLTAPAVWRDFVLVLIVLLASGATAFIWLQEPPTLVSGFMQTGIVWLVSLVGLLGRLQARYGVRELRAIVARGEIMSARLAPDITEAESGLRMRSIPAWAVALLGLAASAVLWQADIIEQTLGGTATIIVGGTFSIMLGLAVAANAINRAKVRRLTRDFKAALASERLALDTLGSIDAMVSACLPTGERTRFNERFVKFVGLPAAQLQGRGWLDVVHPEDREAALEIVARPVTTARAREHDLCLRGRNGEYVWVHETLVPRFDDRGRFIEFICTAIDITARVENEAALHKQISDLKADLARAQEEAAETANQLSETRSELSKTKAARSRLETNLEQAREEIKQLQAIADRADAKIAEARADAVQQIKEAQADARTRVKQAEEAADLRISRIEAAAEERIAKAERAAEEKVGKLEESLRVARQEHQQAAAEARKLQRAFEKLQEELAEFKLQGADLREQVARHIREAREAREQAAEALKSESQHRSRSDRLTQRLQQLESQLAEREAALKAAGVKLAGADAAVAKEIERRLHEVSAQALASQLQRHLEGTQRMMQELMATSLEGPVRDAADNTAAQLRAMSQLVEHALNGTTPPPLAADPAARATFDFRRTARGLQDLLGPEASAHGVVLEIEVAANLRPVHGDETSLRTALMSLISAALAITEEGTLTVRFTEDVSTGAHTTIRCEMVHQGRRISTEKFEKALALGATDRKMPDAAKDPVAHQAALAWRTIRALEGQHGFQLPEGGGFALWFTFTLERPAATTWQRPTPPVAAASSSETAPGDNAHEDRPPPRPVRQHVPRAQSVQPIETTATANRTLPRMPQEFLNCNLGEVAELGAGGMRLFCAKPPRGPEVTITFDPGVFDKEIRAEISWSKKIGRNKHDVGLRFLDLTPEEQKQILRVAMQHRKVVTLLEDAANNS
jgi:PAS domain S-box-containing protein